MAFKKPTERAERAERKPVTIVGGRLTRIAPQRDPARVSLYIDGRFVLGISTAIMEEQGLRVGQDLTAAQVATLHAQDELGKAVDKALAFLTSRPRSIREVRDRLKEK